MTPINKGPIPSAPEGDARRSDAEHELARRLAASNAVEQVTMVAVGSLAETRTSESGNHIRRTQRFIEMLALAVRDHPRFSSYLTDTTVALIARAAPLHDIGKIAVPDRILLKSERLTPDEFEIMKTHTTRGRDAIADAERLLGTTSPFLEIARDIAWSHHERWDGSGYPRGIGGDEIPIAGRLMAIVDVYDALTSKKIYKPAYAHEASVSMIREASGTHFDPVIVSAFLGIAGELELVARRLADVPDGAR